MPIKACLSLQPIEGGPKDPEAETGEKGRVRDVGSETPKSKEAGGGSRWT